MYFPANSRPHAQRVGACDVRAASALRIFFRRRSRMACCCRWICAVALIAICLPATATTLVRCKIDKKIVYSDTECPGIEKDRNGSYFMSQKPSRPIHIRHAKKRTVGNLSQGRSRSRTGAR